VISPRAEALLELEPGANLDDAVDPHVEIHQRLPPRLVIVAADEEGLKALESRPEVRAVFTADVPPETLEQFDESERLFAAGWNERRRPKQRLGEGLPWDAPGFDAP
jgi:hypothetical protein